MTDGIKLKAPGENESSPRIGVVLGSLSDLDRVKGIWPVLERFAVPYEVTVISAHRTPDVLREYCESAPSRGIQLIVGCAGLSAALPGAIASLTDIPVIGLPVASGPLNGVDALLAMAQMPPGVPVATTGINGAANAGLLAVRILAMSNPGLRRQLALYREHLAGETVKQADSLLERGLPGWERGR